MDNPEVMLKWMLSKDAPIRFSGSPTGDGTKPVQQYVAQLQQYGGSVLIYPEDMDYIRNWLGNSA